MTTRRRYRSRDEDSARWDGFAFRAGDIVVSTRSKHGTTWLQTILLLLIHGDTELPASLNQLSPWLDHLVEPRDAVVARLSAQRHRRVIKTHTPLDGVPHDPRVTYVVVARHPLDAAVSLYHQGANLDRDRLGELTGAAPADSGPRLAEQEWLHDWITADPQPHEALDSLPGVMWHLSHAWSRRRQPNVVLVHYADLLADLDGEMRRIADLFGIDVAARDWPALVEAATFASMKSRAQRLAPDTGGVLRSAEAFFRGGVSGGGAQLLDADALRAYHRRAAQFAPADLLAWLHP